MQANDTLAVINAEWLGEVMDLMIYWPGPLYEKSLCSHYVHRISWFVGAPVWSFSPGDDL